MEIYTVWLVLNIIFPITFQWKYINRIPNRGEGEFSTENVVKPNILSYF